MMRDNIKNTVEEETLQGGADKLINFRPVLFCTIFLGLGIGFWHAVKTEGAYWFFLIPLLIAVVLSCVYRTKRALYVIAALTAAFLIGMGGFAFQTARFTDGKGYDGEFVCTGRVVEIAESDEGFSVLIDGIFIDGNSERGKLVAYLPTSFADKVELSDTLLLRGRVRSNYRLFSENGFRAYALENNIRFYAYAEDCAVTGNEFDLFLFIRSRIENRIKAGMDETPASVMLATLTGNTTFIDEGLLENVRRGGIAHIFAVSGLHVGALFGFLLLLVRKTPLRKASKTTRFFLLAGMLLFYGGVCGFSPSILRAIVTCLALYGAKLIGIGTDFIENISFAAIIVLLLSPVSLFHIGFQLSFAACYGIAFLSRPIRVICYKLADKIVKPQENAEDHPQGLRRLAFQNAVSFLSVTLSAQLATLPLLIQAFGYVSVWSLLLNCFAVPLISALFPLFLLAVVIATLLPIAVSTVLLYIPNLIWSALLLVFQIFDFSVVAIEGFKVLPVSLLAYYLALSFLSDKWNFSKRTRGLYFALFAVTFFTVGMV